MATVLVQAALLALAATDWLERKVAAAMAHRAQHAMFLRNTGAPSVPGMVTHIESFHILRRG